VLSVIAPIAASSRVVISGHHFLSRVYRDS
jgi:hypothetical protein